MLTGLTLGIFVLAFIFIAVEVVDKSLVALFGAILMIVIGTLSPAEAVAAIEFETIMLLMSMMLLVNMASKSGIFEWLNVRIASITKGNPVAIFLLFSLLTAVLSAFLDNVTTVILIVPLTIELLRGMGKDPKPYIFAEIVFSNIGGGLTLIGDPPNIIIGGATGFSFTQFIMNLWIPILGASILALVFFMVVNRKIMKPISKDLVDLTIANVLIRKLKNQFVKRTMHLDFVIKVVVVLVLTIVGFFVQDKIGYPTYLIAFMGAVALALMSSKRIDIHHSFESVEWGTLFFFSGLFIMVAGVEKTGVLEHLSTFVANFSDDLFILSLLVLWVSGFASMVLDNIPFVTVMVPVIFGIQGELLATGLDTSILWWALSLGACLGGNATLIGASANVVAADIACKHGTRISFMEYMRFAFPLTVGILIICSIYLFFATL